MRKIIFIILLFYSSISLAEKIDGLFGLKIGEILTKDILAEEHKNRKIGYNQEETIEAISLKNKKDYDLVNLSEKARRIKSINRIKRRLEELESGAIFRIVPKVNNPMFKNYSVEISPLSNKIIVIRGIGDMEEEPCIETRKLLFDHFINKYSSSYSKTSIDKEDDEEEYLTFGFSTGKGHQIRIICSYFSDSIMIEFQDLDYSLKMLNKDKSIMIQKLDNELQKIANKDLDLSGM